MDDFIKEYFEQDNCGTAYPIYFVIRDVAWVAGHHFSDGDRFTLIYDCEAYLQNETLKGLFEDIKKDEDGYGLKISEYLDIDDYISESDCDDFTSDNEFVNGIFAEKKDYENKNMFLLKSEAEEHLKANHYHYSKEARVYCMHAWRAPRQEQFLEGLKQNLPCNEVAAIINKEIEG